MSEWSHYTKTIKVIQINTPKDCKAVVAACPGAGLLMDGRKIDGVILPINPGRRGHATLGQYVAHSEVNGWFGLSEADLAEWTRADHPPASRGE